MTGASGGLGAAIARAFAHSGARVFLHYKSGKDRADALAASLPHPERHLALYADAACEDSVVACMRELGAASGGKPLSVLVNNAGIYPCQSLATIDAQSWHAVVDATLSAAHFFTRGALPLMRKGSSIVNIASIEGHRPARERAHYAAAKAALIHYTKSLALELGPRGIRANAVSPGLIWREGLDKAWPDGYARFVAAAPLARAVLPEEVAAACLFLASGAASAITGIDMSVDAGADIVAAQDFFKV